MVAPIQRLNPTTEELSIVLSDLLSQHFQAPHRVTSLRRRVSNYSSSCIVENLEVELDQRIRLHLVLKDLSSDSLLATAQKVRPRFLYAPLREIAIYRDLLSHRRLGTPICYGTLATSTPERTWLFLERVNGPLLWQSGRIEHWMQAARWLARLHSECRIEDSALPGHLLRYDARFYSLWLKRAEEFLRQKPCSMTTEARRKFARLTDHYDQVIQSLLALPLTFIHGEFYPSNIIVRRAQQEQPVCALDWELGAIAPGLIDLAALISGRWGEAEKNKMVAAYRESLNPTRGGPLSLADFTHAIICCQLHLAVQLLGWSASWSPPPDHAQNWLRIAAQLAERIGL
jgi:hypothetical protein